MSTSSKFRFTPYPEDADDISSGAVLGEEEWLTVRKLTSNIDENYRGRNICAIHLWCFRPNGARTHLRIKSYPIQMYIELPDRVNGKRLFWGHSTGEKVLSYFKFCCNLKKVKEPVSIKIENKFGTDSYSSDRKTFALMTFQDFESFRYVIDLIRRKNKEGGCMIREIGCIKFVCHETNIDVLRKLLTEKNVEQCSWFRVKGRRVPLNYPERLALKKYDEYFIDYTSIRRTEESYPIFPVLMGYDIEVYTDNPNIFPVETELNHCAYMISLVTTKLEHPETTRRICLLYGKAKSVDGVEVYTFKTEVELIEAFAKVVRYLDPDIMQGYNNFTFDVNYLVTRYDILTGKEFPAMGRTNEKFSKVVENSWKSGAYGEVKMRYYDVTGRIDLDMLLNVKRLKKLRTYTLNAVSKELLGRGKLDMPAKEMFRIFKLFLDNDPTAEEEMTRVIKYCIVDSELVNDLFQKMNIWYYLSELSNVAGVTIPTLYTSGEQIRCFYSTFHECHRQGYVLTKPDIKEFFVNGGYVGDPITGVHPEVYTLDFNSLYPSIMIAYNMCYTTFLPRDKWHTVDINDCYVFRFKQKEKSPEPSEGYAETQSGLDFSDIPDDIYEEDEDEEIIPMKEDYEAINGEFEEGYEEEVLIQENNKKKKEEKFYYRGYEFRFVKPHIREGILPKLQRERIEARKVIKNKLKDEKGKLKKVKDDASLSKEEKEQMIRDINCQISILDAQQGAVKVMANATYGYVGALKGFMPCLPIAMCVCARGRQHIKETNRHIRTKFASRNAKIVYNDTDSSMFSLDRYEGETLKQVGEMVLDTINGRPAKKDKDGNIIEPEIPPLFPPPLKMELENCTQMFCIKKKMYAKLYRDLDTGEFIKDDYGNYKIDYKGITTARRGKSAFTKTVYNEGLLNILLNNHFADIISALQKHFVKLLAGEIPLEDLVMVAEMGHTYKNAKATMVRFSNYMHSRGRPIKPSERAEFVVVQTNNPEHKIGDRMREFSLWKEDGIVELFDPIYYIRGNLEQTFDTLIKIGYSKHFERLEQESKQICYDPSCFFEQFKRKKPISIATPVKLIATFVEHHINASVDSFTRLYYKYPPLVKDGCFYQTEVRSMERFKQVAVILDNYLDVIKERIRAVIP